MNATALRNALMITLASASSAFAAGPPREDNSGLFVYIFLGFCALIIALQVMPAILMLFGFAKGIAKEKTPAAQTVTNK